MDLILSYVIRCIVFFSKYAKQLSKTGLIKYESYIPGERVKILVVGYNGARNTGADARVVSIVRQVMEVFGRDKVEITVMTLDPSLMEGYFPDEVRLLKFSSIFPLPLFKACSEHHVALISEGSTLKSTFADALTMFFVETSGIMAAQNKPCLAYGCEIGDMEPYLTKLAKDLCQDTYFVTRSQGSQKALEELGLKGHMGTDTAWDYEYEISIDEAEKLLKEQGWDGRQKLIGAAVIDPFCWPVKPKLLRWLVTRITGSRDGSYDKWYYFSISPQRSEAFEAYLDNIAGAVSSFAEKEQAFPVVIGMEKLDLEACTRLAGKLSGRCAVFCSNQENASVMTGILRKLDYLITSRYHAFVLGMDSHYPVVSVSMDERLNNINEETGLSENYLFKVTDKNLNEELSRALSQANARSNEISDQLVKSNELYLERLDEMKLFMKEYITARLG